MTKSNITQIHEPSLFDDEPEPEAPRFNFDAFDTTTEHRLDHHSSITHVRGLVTGDHELMHQLSVFAVGNSGGAGCMTASLTSLD